jgi:hypothetical protein
MEFLENYAAKDNMESCFDYISNVVHFLGTHAENSESRMNCYLYDKTYHQDNYILVIIYS